MNPAGTVRPADDDTLAQLGWSSVLADLELRCRSGPGRARAAALPFLAEAAAARERMAEIAEARDLAASVAPMPLVGLADLREQVRRAEKGSALDPAELVAVAEAARACDRLRRHLLADHAAERAPRLAARAARIPDLGHVFHPILDVFDENGRLVDHASDDLAALRRQAARVRADLERRGHELIEDPRLAESLQDRYVTQRDDRCVLPVKVEARGRVRGIVHDTSHSGQTVFIEPEPLIELGNQLVLAQHAVADEERRILVRLSAYVAEDAAPLRASVEEAAELDVLAAAADQADALRAAVPSLDEPGAAIDLVQARHPLMELGGRPCVPNDVRLARATALVVSGPNAGGKTVALKTTGLAVLMARAGLPVAAAPESSLPWVDRVVSDIGDAQSLEKDLSTFSGHLLRVEAVLRAAGPGTLVLLDELCVGTEPEQGAAMAQAVLETLVARGASVLVTTHYERLKVLAASDPRFANASVGFDLERMEPTFQLHLGVPGSSGAIALARRLAVEPEVVARAEAVLGDRRAGVEELILSLEAERRRAAEDRVALERARAEVERERAAAEAARERAAERERLAREASHDQAVAALRDARRELDELRAAVRRRRREVVGRASAAAEGASGALSGLGAEVDAAAARIAALAPQRPQAGEAPDAAQLRPGVAVHVVSLDAGGVIAGAPERGRVAVQVGALRTTAVLSDLRLSSRRERREQAHRADAPRAAPAGGARSARTRDQVQLVTAPTEGRALRRTPEATLDVRGERVDDALAALDRFLDESMRAEREAVFVVHGHGTGALRQAVRRAVAAHPAVREHRAGEPNEGGDGVTVVWLDA